MGIHTKKQWIATLDGRTRHSHRILDGETIDNDKKFSNGCEYPGDPNGPANEIYNCRCTLIASIKGFERNASSMALRRNAKLGTMSYDEWKKEHGVSQDILYQEKRNEAMRRSAVNEYRRK